MGTVRSQAVLNPGGHVNVSGRCLVGLEIPFLPLPKGWLLVPSSGIASSGSREEREKGVM